MLKMIVLQSSNSDSLVMDCFAGSGSTLLAAEQAGRKWIGIDQSDYSAEVIKERFRKVDFDYIKFSDIEDDLNKEQAIKALRANKLFNPPASITRSSIVGEQ